MSTDPAQAALDRFAIQDLLARGAQAQDDHDWDLLAGCYEPTPPTSTRPASSRASTRSSDRSRRALSSLDASQHLVGSILVTLDGDEAEASSYFQAQHVRNDAEGGPRLIIAGTYRDRLTRRSGAWRIAERRRDLHVARREPRGDPASGKHTGMKADELAALDLYDDAVTQCPYPYLAELRRDAPVVWNESVGAFVVTRHETIRQIARNPALFSSQFGRPQVPVPPEHQARIDAIIAEGYPRIATLLTADPPAHTQVPAPGDEGVLSVEHHGAGADDPPDRPPHSSTRGPAGSASNSSDPSPCRCRSR